jgi:hypothetical protein
MVEQTMRVLSSLLPGNKEWYHASHNTLKMEKHGLTWGRKEATHLSTTHSSLDCCSARSCSSSSFHLTFWLVEVHRS